MFLNLNFLGVSYFTSIGTSLSGGFFDKITVYGGNVGCVVDKLWGRNITIDDTTINNYNPTNYSPEWDTNTYILGEYNNDLTAGNVTGITTPIVYWLIYRQDPNNNQLTYLDKIDVTTTSFKDYKATLNNKYSYYIFGQSATELSNPLISESVKSDYWGYYLLDPEMNQAFRFDWNSGSSDFDYQENYTQYETNLQYDAFSRGKRKAISGSIQAIIRNESSDIFEQTNEQLALLKEFIFSNRVKYLKDKRGRIWKIFTYGYKENQLNEGLSEQVIVSSFNFIENGSVY